MNLVKGRPKTGGRQKGTPNKIKAIVRETVAECLGRDAIVELCERYKSEDDNAIAAGLLKEIVSYCYPKLKAVEHTGKDGEDLLPAPQPLSHSDLVEIVKSIRKDMHGEGKS